MTPPSGFPRSSTITGFRANGGAPWRLPCRHTSFPKLEAGFGRNTAICSILGEEGHSLRQPAKKSESALLSTSIQVSGVQINPNREQLRAEEADRGGIADAARQLIREPVLPLAWIIVGE
jgi:hypothetical protein